MTRIVFASSGGTVYGIPNTVPVPETHATQPLCSYGIHKLAIEQYLHLFHSLHGLEDRVLRLSNPFGSGSGATRRRARWRYFSTVRCAAKW